jgi:hypothetical protein
MQLPIAFQRELATVVDTFKVSMLTAKKELEQRETYAENARSQHTERLVKATDFFMRHGYVQTAQYGETAAEHMITRGAIGGCHSVETYIREVAKELNRPACLIKPSSYYGVTELQIPEKAYCRPLHTALDVLYESTSAQDHSKIGFSRTLTSNLRRYFFEIRLCVELLDTWKKNAAEAPEFRKALGLPPK